MTLEEAKAQIRQVILNAAEGSFYPDERQRIKDAILALFFHSRPYEHGHIRELQNWIDTFERPRKAQQCGYQQVRSWILQQLDKIHGTTGEITPGP